VLFLDELPEFARSTLEALRQPIEAGRVIVARANAHLTYPARVQVIAAMNPCRCGYFGEAGRDCGRMPRCAQDYQMRLSGPLLDRFDIRLDVPSVSAQDLLGLTTGETSRTIAARVAQARQIQKARNLSSVTGVSVLNAALDGDLMETAVVPDAGGKELLRRAMERYKLSGRGYYRILRVSRTLADLAGGDAVKKEHIAEALNYRCSGTLLLGE
jgi:magnesium chelatase family protein